MSTEQILDTTDEQYILKYKNGKITHICFDKDLDLELYELIGHIVDNKNFVNQETQKVSLRPTHLFPYLDKLKESYASGNMCLEKLLLLLDSSFSEKNEAYDSMMAKGKITFDYLHKLFNRGQKIISSADGFLFGGVIDSNSIGTDQWGQKLFVIKYKYVSSNGNTFLITTGTLNIPFFVGSTDVSNLSVKPIDISSNIYSELRDRGRQYEHYALKFHHLAYKGMCKSVDAYGRPCFIHIDSRVIVDCEGSMLYNHNYNIPSLENLDTNIDEQWLFTCPSSLMGYVFNIRKWCALFITNYSPIQFNDNAFSKLVLDAHKKDVIESLVTHCDHSFSDIISGKSGGAVMLFHGTPGLGKTLTCEAIAEKMHKPLYSVTVGDIGTDARTVEANLSKIISLSHRWMAIILLDEADIFLEQRTINDIQRNALVGIFLRLLEKYSGIFILTTNRIETIDEAFKSRISIFLKYKDFTATDRFQVISNMLELIAPSNDITLEYVKDLSQMSLNGRQIKNYIRMANCIALSKKEVLADKHIQNIIAINEY